MQILRNNKVDSLTTRSQNLHGRKFSGAADAVALQDLTTLNQVTNAITTAKKQAIAAIPVPLDLTQIKVSPAPSIDNNNDLGAIGRFWNTIRGYVINAKTKYQINGVDGITGSFTYVKTVNFAGSSVTTGTVTVVGGIVTSIT